MRTDELIEACDRLLHPNDQEDGYAWANAARDRIAVASALRERLATEPQQAERIATFERERDEARRTVAWVCRKLGIPEDSALATGESTIAGAMHVLAAHAHGYKTYIETFKCDEKQGEIARLTVERDESRAAYCALRDSVQKLYVAGNCETHGSEDWWWCDCLAGINGKEGIIGTHPDKPEWRKGDA